MIEIILIVYASMKVAALLKQKGCNAVLGVTLFVCLCLGGEVLGFAFATVLWEALTGERLDQDGSLIFVMVLGGWMGLAIACIIGYIAVLYLPPLENPYREVLDDGTRPLRHEVHDDRDYLREALDGLVPEVKLLSQSSRANQTSP